MKYETLDWASLDYLKAHLYKRISNPLTNVLETLEQAKIGSETLPEKLSRSQHTAQAMLSTLNAWATLINYKQHGELSGFQFRAFNKASIPAWVKLQLEQQTTLRLDFEQSIEVHHETFLESLLLLYQVVQSVSHVVHIQLSDAPPPKQGVYLRVVFYHQDKAPFSSLFEIQNKFDLENAVEHDLALQLMVAKDMMALNRARFNLQNNKKTGQQALSAYFAAVADSTNTELKANAIQAPPVAPVVVTPPTPTPNAEVTIVVEAPPTPAEPPPLPDKRQMPLHQLTRLMEEEPTDLESIDLSQVYLPVGYEAQEGEDTLKRPSGDGTPSTSFNW